MFDSDAYMQNYYIAEQLEQQRRFWVQWYWVKFGWLEAMSRDATFCSVAGIMEEQG